MTPRPPAFYITRAKISLGLVRDYWRRLAVTAAASLGPAATFIPASMIGCVIPNVSVNVVLIGPLGMMIFVFLCRVRGCGENVGGGLLEERKARL